MKNLARLILQKLLGFDNYLYIFSILTIKRLEQNIHEKEFLHFITLIPNEGTVLDIGANIGITSVPLAKKLNNTRVYSFEPMPENLRALKRVVRHFKLDNVRIFENALGDEAGELKMVLPVIDNVKMQGLSHVYNEGDSSEANKGQILTVPVKKLDDMPELNALPKISAIKIDVENFEYNVLKGAKELLMKHKPTIYCELWDDDKRTLTMNYLKEIGYKVQVFDGKKLVDFSNQNVINFFFINLN